MIHSEGPFLCVIPIPLLIPPFSSILLLRGPRREALENALRAAIRSGRLGPGDRIPSTRALALDLGLSRGTVVEAYTQLTAEGYLDAERGSGTRVSELGPSALAVADRGRRLP